MQVPIYEMKFQEINILKNTKEKKWDSEEEKLTATPRKVLKRNKYRKFPRNLKAIA